MRTRLQFVITAVVLCHLFPRVPLVISQALPDGQSAEENVANQEQSSGNFHFSAAEGEPLTIYANHQEQQGDVSTLQGNVEIHFRGYTLRGDTVTYNKVTGNATAEGHVSLDGGSHDIHMTATHGTYNIRSRTGTFYDVAGTTGERLRGRNVTLTSSNPIAFWGEVVDKTGEDEYVIHKGKVTSCELPRPKWTFRAAKIVIEIGNSAHVYHSIFWIRGVPVIYLPYAAPPVERVGRQSGFLLPVAEDSSTKGFVLGDAFYWAINRSMDTTVGGEYLSQRGWALHEIFRARPTDSSFVNFDYFGVDDRLGQGGEDIKLSGETRLPGDFRAVASLEYLSSLVFRLAFNENFAQAVNSEVKSVAFISKTYQAFSVNAFASRYQNFESTAPGDVITIFHAPGLDVSSVDQRLGGSPLFWSWDAAADGLRRSEPGFNTPNLTGRFDLEPDVSLPLFFAGWTVRPEVALRNTFYTESQLPGPVIATPIQQTLDRRSVETAVEVRPPTLGRVFDRTLAGRKIKHTIEPYLIYRYTNGINNFPSIIRFDYRDVLSDTNEAEYGLTQRLYFKHVNQDCNTAKPAPESGKTTADENDSDQSTSRNCTPAGANEFVTWELKQKYFLDPTFGGAVVPGERNVLTTTVDFAGIAFLTDPRRFAPIVSNFRVRTSANSDLQWELDYDTTKGRINASMFFTTFHFGDFFLGGSQAYFQVLPNEILPTTPAGITPVSVATPTQFNQFRVLGGYGNSNKRGLSVATSVGFDYTLGFVQYTSAQATYNWDCCGVSVEYLQFDLGQVRPEHALKYSLTLANIGSFGTIRHQEKLF